VSDKRISRRDDLLSLFLLLAFLHSGRVQGDADVPNIKQLRATLDVHKVCKEFNCGFLLNFAEAVTALKFEEEPNYNRLRFLLEKNVLNLNQTPSKYMDWLYEPTFLTPSKNPIQEKQA